MNKKYYIITLVLFCLMLILNISTVNATKEVTDREMAIASAMSYVPLQKNKTMSQCFDIANKKINKPSCKLCKQ